jgi:hypothetical protein
MSATATELEAIVVSADDIVEAFERNRRDADEQRSHVLRVTPPLKGERSASLHVSEDYSHYPPEMDPEPIHLAPEQFVGDDSPRVTAQYQPPTYSAERAKFIDHNNLLDEETGEVSEFTDGIEAEFDEWWDVAGEVWESEVRGALRNEITIQQRTADGIEKIPVKVHYVEKQGPQ